MMHGTNFFRYFPVILKPIHMKKCGMQFTLSFIISILFLRAVISEYESIHLDRYLSLIIKICDMQQASTVLFSYPSKFGEDLKVNTIFNSWIHVLSRRGINTQSIFFWEPWKIFTYYRRISQPLFVVLLTNEKSVVDFSEFARHVGVSFPVWLVIFLESSENYEVDYCHKPTKNIFNIDHHTEMMVVCENDDIVRQWYFRNNKTEISDLAVWKPDYGFVKLSSQSVNEKRSNLKGITLRAAVVTTSSVARLINGKWVGYFGKVIEELSQMANFTIKVTEVVEYGGWYEDNGWNGAVSEVVSGRADIAVADFSMTTQRMNYLDFTLPLMVADYCLFIREPRAFSVRWLAYFETLSADIWLNIIFILLVSPFLLAIMKIRKVSRELIRFVYDNYLYVWGIFCQQGVSEFPKQFSIRLAYFSIFISALVVSAAYSAALISILTVHTRILPFTSMDTFVKDGSYKLLVVRDTVDYEIFAFANDSLSIKAMSMMEQRDKLPPTRWAAVSQICTDDKAAFYTSDKSMQVIGFDIPCRLSSIRAGRMDTLSMILKKDSPYTAVLNRHLQKLFNNGMLQRIKHESFKKISHEERTYDAVCFGSVLPILFIFAVGVFLSIFMLILEKAYFHYTKGLRSSVYKDNT